MEVNMKKTITNIIILILFFTNISFAEDGNLNKGLSAVLIGNYNTGEIIYQYNIDETIEIASITKLMTYTVAMDIISNGDSNLDDIVTIGKNPTMIGGSTFELKQGEKVELQTLLEAVLIASGNDACVAVAEYLVGSEEEFVKLMNEKVEELGLKSGKFINSSGMPIRTKEGDKIQNLMSVKDIFKLSRYVINKYPNILEITEKVNIDVPGREYFKENTNPLLKELEKVDGLKTGYTDKAGYCLISTLEIPKNNNNFEKFRIISIAMGAKTKEDRKEKSKVLLEYTINNYNNKQIISKNQVIEEIDIDNATKQKIQVYSKDNVVKLVNNNDKIETNICINKNIVAPLSKGDKIGKIEVYINGKKSEEVDLIVNRKVEKESFLIRLFRSIQNFILRVDLKNILTDLI